MRDREWLDAVRDRVLAEIKAHPPVGPLLLEEPTETRPFAPACKRGHARTAPGTCQECRRMGRKIREAQP